VQLCDNQGRSALAYARNSSSVECCQLLIHNGCPDSSSENSISNGNTPGSSTSSQNTFSHKSHMSTSFMGEIHNGLSNFS